jgi:peptide/nickel transport system substrate-binding protein
MALLGTALCCLAGEAENSLTISQRAEPRTFHPLLAVDQPTRDVLRMLHADLVHINRRTLRTEAALAESWTVAKDGRSIEVRLRRGLRFSDGAPCTASDVRFTFELHLDERNASAQRDLLVVHGQPIRVTQLSAERLRFDFAAPYAPAERIFDSIHILPRHILEEPYRRGELAKAWGTGSDPEKVVGMGPFRLSRYAPQERLTLVRNANYYRAPLPYLARVDVRFFGDAEAEVLQFRSGTLDWVNRIAAKSFEALRGELASKGYQFLNSQGSLEYHFLFFNLNDGRSVPEGVRAKQALFRDENFRRAIWMALDREAIARLVYAGQAVPIWQPVSPANAAWWNTKLPRPAQSIAAARKLLLEGRYAWDAGGKLLDREGRSVVFTLACNSANPQHRAMASIVEQDLSRLGITVLIVPLEFRSLVDRVLNTRDYEAAIMALASGDADPAPEMAVWLNNARSHIWNLKPTNPEVWEVEMDRLMREQLTEMDRSRRFAIFARVQALAQEHLPLISLVSPHVLSAAKPRLKVALPGILPPYGLDELDEVRWEGRAK